MIFFSCFVVGLFCSFLFRITDQKQLLRLHGYPNTTLTYFFARRIWTYSLGPTEFSRYQHLPNFSHTHTAHPPQNHTIHIESIMPPRLTPTHTTAVMHAPTKCHTQINYRYVIQLLHDRLYKTI